MWERFLFNATSVVALTFLAGSLWFGLYIMTRSRRRSSWLVSAILWSLSGSFLHALIHLHAPPGEAAFAWWPGWSIALTMPFWFHLSAALLPEHESERQKPVVVAAYALTLVLVAMEAYTPWVFSGASGRPDTLLSSATPGPLYPAYGGYFVVILGLSLCNFWRGWRQSEDSVIARPFAVLTYATLLGLFGAIYAWIFGWLMADAPRLVVYLSMGGAAALLGVAVANHNALIGGRTIRLDLAYSAAGMGIILAIYLLASLISIVAFGGRFVSFALVVVLAVSTHSLHDWGRNSLDRLFYRRQHRQLRANLTQFSRATASEVDVQARLRRIFAMLCQSVEASRGFIALRQGEQFQVSAHLHTGPTGRLIVADQLLAQETTLLPADPGVDSLAGMALLTPLHASGGQVGAIVLGAKGGNGSYSEDDLEIVEDCADHVAGVVDSVQLRNQNVDQIDALLREFGERERDLQRKIQVTLARPEALAGRSERQTTALVEDALRHMGDYPYLGDHALAALRIVDSHLSDLEGTYVTHIDRGKALQWVLEVALDKLKPPGKRPTLPGHEWHQYVILHDCYVRSELNRDVMSTLYISEGTFNRGRRRAIRAVARALAEMESEAQRSVQT